MDKWQYKAELLAESRRQQEQMSGFLRRNWLIPAALIFAIVGTVIVVLFFQAERTETETSGHLWWKDETTTTTEVPLGTRLLYLFIGLGLITVAALCVYMRIRQAALRASHRKYLAILTGFERMKVQQIAGIANSSPSTVYRDIQRMIDSGLVDDVHIDYQAEEVISKKYIPKSSHKTVVTCRACGANNELIVGITRSCGACGEPLVLNTPP
ncbi:hypothetical protein [Microbacterium sp.]|uniref:hypothetical protein n=1 Tax=Microbacterium sp. TaxID=51671 RepID=UPI002733BFA5|nr:hypothetical protein [Microbacterium sp.]MDP3953170.1 hypothetical protein [Microbacterium sp.]